MQPFQFLFLFSQLLNHALHGRGHKRGRILRPRPARLELLFVLFPLALKKLPHQKHHQPGDHQERNRQSPGNLPKVLRVARVLQCSEHCSFLLSPLSLLCEPLCSLCLPRPGRRVKSFSSSFHDRKFVTIPESREGQASNPQSPASHKQSPTPQSPKTSPAATGTASQSPIATCAPSPAPAGKPVSPPRSSNPLGTTQ